MKTFLIGRTTPVMSLLGVHSARAAAGEAGKDSAVADTIRALESARAKALMSRARGAAGR